MSDAEENLAFAQERSANNYIRATLAEQKLAEEVRNHLDDIRLLQAAEAKIAELEKKNATQALIITQMENLYEPEWP